MNVRHHSHAGSWYIQEGQELNAFLHEKSKAAEKTIPEYPDSFLKAAIVPHAGYTYCARTAVYSLAKLKPESIKTVFILGPSHFFYSTGLNLSDFDKFKTPLGDLDIDAKITSELERTKEFGKANRNQDLTEHSIEMMCPLLKHFMGNTDFKIVPIIVGQVSANRLKRYAEILLPYYRREDSFFIISSDFCHWGERFEYTWKHQDGRPIHESIEFLDRKGMENISSIDPSVFSLYLNRYQNTICGRFPILILLNILKLEDNKKFKVAIEWPNYTQSEKITDPSQSSVSYAAGLVLYKSKA